MITSKHNLNEDGNPSGGETTGVGLTIYWQDGPVDVVPDGASVEDVLRAAIDRLNFFQDASKRKFACRENAIALTHLETALLWLEKRTKDREARGVEGTYKP